MKIALISDIHEDYISLMQAARIIEQKKCDKVICLGDIVGFSIPFYDYIYSRNASACIEWISKNCDIVVAGNHDLYAVRKVPRSKVRSFKYPDNWYALSFAERRDMAGSKIWLYEDNELSALLDYDDVAFLSSLPELVYTEIGGLKCMFTHFVYPDMSGSAKFFIQHEADIAKHIKLMKDNHVSLSFTGHMHFEGMTKLNKKHMAKFGFGKKENLNNFDWVSIPAISNSKNKNGFLIWDTENMTIETISLHKKFKFL